MAERLRFGTAGLRGPLGNGQRCMNVEQVELAATAIAKWLPAGSTVIIGRDARHGSEAFANVTARVLSAAGHRPQAFAEPVPTPVVAHRVAVTDAAAGVMVTASHNPATDNGYKVYTADGAQLLPEHAAVIEASMSELPWPTSVDASPIADVHLLGATEVEAYTSVILGAVGVADGGITVAYTAMHGVGGACFVDVLRRGGHVVHSVPEQRDPDPNFPTAPFPNPEEPGTLDLVTSLAARVDADLVLANDPDADRLAVAVKRETGWERLTGDQIGVLLAWHVLASADRPCTVASSIVSSSLLDKLAAGRGAEHVATLTGFKWLARAGSPEAPLVFAYEEALGYSVIPSIRDKDGISAGLAFANLAASLKAAGRTVDDVLAELGAEFGHHATGQVSVRFDGDDPMSKMAAVMEQLRSDPPVVIGGFDVVEAVDMSEPGGEFAPADVLTYHLDGARLIVRPSGTEPKIKAYLEAIHADPATAQRNLDTLRTATNAVLGV